MAHTRRKELLWGWWWPVAKKLVLDQIVTSVPEIMDNFLY
jgi:hypothetical protein